MLTQAYTLLFSLQTPKLFKEVLGAQILYSVNFVQMQTEDTAYNALAVNLCWKMDSAKLQYPVAII